MTELDHSFVEEIDEEMGAEAGSPKSHVHATPHSLKPPGEPPPPSPADTTKLSSPGITLSEPVRWLELILGALALVAWLSLFGGAILVGTSAYRAALASPAGFWVALKSGAVVFAFWTITNLGILACLAAFLGALGRRTRFAIGLGTPVGPSDAVPRPVSLFYASAIIRGFSVYSLVMAGLIVLVTESFLNTSQEQYIRLAATTSVISFCVGYDPELIGSLLQKVRRTVEGKMAEKTDGKK